jgi:hypothetical protein
MRAKWSPQEEILFALGMLEKYLNFRHTLKAHTTTEHTNLCCILLLSCALFPTIQQKLGLGLLGAKLRVTWSPQEEILFALGMLEKYRNTLFQIPSPLETYSTEHKPALHPAVVLHSAVYILSTEAGARFARSQAASHVEPARGDPLCTGHAGEVPQLPSPVKLQTLAQANCLLLLVAAVHRSWALAC